jgi:hypothetical protein
MLKFGILTPEQFLALGDERWRSVPRVSYNLLDVGDHPTADQIQIFEDISFSLRTSNGTFRTTFRHRFQGVDIAVLRWMQQSYAPDASLRVQDRAVSHGLTTAEWAAGIFTAFPNAHVEGSDLLFHLIELRLDTGEIYIVEPNGTPLQYIKAPFVVQLHHRDSWRYPVNRWVAAHARHRFENLPLPAGWMETSGGPGFSVRRIPYIHPEARALTQEYPNLTFCLHSVFDRTAGSCQVLRTMNIFNPSYFTREQLLEGVSAVFDSLETGGLWIVGRTLEEDFSNHVTIFRKSDTGWKVMERIGNGWESENLC